MVQVKAKILLHKRIAPDHLLMRLKAPAVARRAQPGQFIHVQCGDVFNGDTLGGRVSLLRTSRILLRRPFSLLDVDAKAGTVDFIYKVVGLGTKVLSDVPQGQRVDILGPLGSIFTMPAQMKRAYLVGGGVGIPPLFFLAKKLLRQRANNGQRTQVKVFLGARTKGWVICAQMFRRLGVETRVATDDGTLGYRGSVVDLLRQSLRTGYPSTSLNGDDVQQTTTLYICGPTPMMETASRLASNEGLAAQVSLEERMGCAMGCCMGCVVEIATQPAASHNKRFQRVCTEGPVFPAEAVVWKAH